nr:C2 domain containing protein [Tanacetum cinerariifolium]
MKKKGMRIDMSEITEFLNELMVEKPVLPLLIPLLLVLWSIEKWMKMKKKGMRIDMSEITEFLNELMVEKPVLPLLIPLLLVLWSIEKWFFNLSNWVPLAVAVWATIQEKIELLEFSLGSCPPILGMHGAQWSSAGDQRFIRMGFDWDTSDISIMLQAKFAMGTAKIVVNNIHIKGDFNLYECSSDRVNYDYLATCEIKLRYCTDDSTIFWAVGDESSVIAKHAAFCGQEIEMVVPFEGTSSAKLKVKLTLKEWQFSGGLHSLSGSHLSTRASSLFGSTTNLQPKTGRKIYVTVVEGKELLEKDRSGKSYVKLQYGKTIQRTRSAANASQPTW